MRQKICKKDVSHRNVACKTDGEPETDHYIISVLLS